MLYKSYGEKSIARSRLSIAESKSRIYDGFLKEYKEKISTLKKKIRGQRPEFVLKTEKMLPAMATIFSQMWDYGQGLEFNGFN